MLLLENSTGRKSLSALHNNDNNGKSTTSMSKTYTNNKKEELLKVINEAKQKLENVSSAFYILFTYSFKKLGFLVIRHFEIVSLKNNTCTYISSQITHIQSEILFIFIFSFQLNSTILL